VLTLYTTPVIYLYFDRLARRLGGGAESGPLHDEEELPRRTEPA
jgi:hypothetical protein